MVDLVQIQVRLTGGKAAAAEAQALATSIEETGAAASTANKKAAASTGAIGKSLKSHASTMRAAGSQLKTHLTYPLLAVGAASVGFAVQFDKSMRNVNSIAGLPEAQFDRLKQSVLDLAGPTNQAPNTLAEGLYDLVSSGFDAAESMQILRHSAKAATAGLTTTEVSTKAVAAVLNAYELPAKRAGAVSDTLFETVNRGVIRFDELANSIGDVLPFSSQLHVSLNEIGAATSTMTKAGISPSETMTRLKNVMVTLIKPGKDLSDELDRLGMTGSEIVQKKGLQGTIDILTKGKTREQIAALFPNIRALGGAMALTGLHAKAAHADLKAFADTTGSTNKVFKEQEKSFSFKVSHAFNELKVALIELAPALLALTPALVGFMEGLAGVLGVFTKLPGPVKAFILIMLGLAALAGPVLSLVGAVGALDVALAPVLIVVAIAAAIVALGVAFVYAYKRIGWFHDAVDSVFSFVKSHWQWLLIPLAPILFPIITIIRNLDHLKDAWGWIKQAVSDVIDFMQNSTLGKVLTAPLRAALFVARHLIEAYEKVKGFIESIEGSPGPTVHADPRYLPGGSRGGPKPPTSTPGSPGSGPFGIEGIHPPRSHPHPRTGRRSLSSGLGGGGDRIRPSTRAQALGASGGRSRPLTVPVYIGKRQVAEAQAEIEADDRARL